jgi:hypothetical protein
MVNSPYVVKKHQNTFIREMLFHLFSAVSVFQKSYTGNILGIGRNKFQKSYFSRMKDEDRTRAGGGPEAAHTTGGRGPAPGRAHPW